MQRGERTRTQTRSPGKGPKQPSQDEGPKEKETGEPRGMHEGKGIKQLHEDQENE